MICVGNAWNMHRKCAAQLDEKPKKLKSFVATVSDSLDKAGKQPRGQPSSLPTPPQKKREVPVKVSDKGIHKDSAGHFLIFSEQRMRCKNCPPKSNKFAFVIYTKCQVLLCLNKKVNCFREFHHGTVDRPSISL